MSAVEIYRTPEENFQNLPEFEYKPNYIEVKDSRDIKVRMHYLDEGRGDTTVLLLHGEPSWCYLYRNVIAALPLDTCRVIAPDLIGMGRSDKPVEQKVYSYSAHYEWLLSFIEQLDLNNIILFCQDWGGLLGLRAVGLEPQRFAGVVAANTGLPTGEQKMPDVWHQFHDFIKNVTKIPVGRMIQNGCVNRLSAEVKKAYAAPYPEEKAMGAVRSFPSLIPQQPDHPEGKINRQAFENLQQFDKPFLTAFSDSDPITRRGDLLLRRYIPGAKKRKDHVTIKDAGHFLQEDRPVEVAGAIKRLLKSDQ